MRRALAALVVIGALVFAAVPAEAKKKPKPKSSTTSTTTTTLPRRDVVAQTIAVGEDSGRLVLSPDGSQLYVTDDGPDPYTAGTVTVIDTSERLRVANDHGGPVPAGIAVSRDGSRVYVANGGHDDTVSVIDTRSGAVAQTIGLGPNRNPHFVSGASGFGLNPQGVALVARRVPSLRRRIRRGRDDGHRHERRVGQRNHHGRLFPDGSGRVSGWIPPVLDQRRKTIDLVNPHTDVTIVDTEQRCSGRNHRRRPVILGVGGVTRWLPRLRDRLGRLQPARDRHAQRHDRPDRPQPHRSRVRRGLARRLPSSTCATRKARPCRCSTRARARSCRPSRSPASLERGGVPGRQGHLRAHGRRCGGPASSMMSHRPLPAQLGSITGVRARFLRHRSGALCNDPSSAT